MRRNYPSGADTASPPDEAWLFAQALLGNPIPHPAADARRVCEEREELEWLASISTEHEQRLRDVRSGEAKARADRQDLEWLASISTRHEEQLRRVLAAEARAREAQSRYERFVENLHEAYWDPAKHPRLGGPPNAGWFATTGGSGGSSSGRAGTGTKEPPEHKPEDEPKEAPPRMLELARAWWHTRRALQQARNDIQELPGRIAREKAQLGTGGRYAYIHTQNLAKARQDLETAKSLAPQLEDQLRELEKEYHDSGYDNIGYGTWTPGEMRAGGVGIEKVGHAATMSGRIAGLKPTHVEIDIALGVGGALQLGKAALRKGATARSLARGPTRAPLTTRVGEMHEALHPIAQVQRTTAILETTSGTRIVAGGARDLTPVQKALLAPDEVAARLPGAHAEVTALRHARQSGLKPTKITASRPFCAECARAIEEAGGKITSPTTAEFPR